MRLKTWSKQKKTKIDTMFNNTSRDPVGDLCNLSTRHQFLRDTQAGKLLVSMLSPLRPSWFVLRCVGGVNSARKQDSSVGGGAGVICLGAVHMEEGVQVRVQVEVGREEAGEGETHGESQNEDATRNKRSTAHHGWHEYGVTRACRHLSLEPCIEYAHQL